MHENPSLVYAMTPSQEIGNAVSMILPTAVLAFNAWTAPHKLVIILCLGSSMHLPVSFTYHLGAAFNRYPDRLDNDMRRLDQSMQHVAGTIFSYALSGSLKYALLNSLLNLRGVYLLWKTETSNDGKRWVPVLFCVLMYTFPMLWRGDFQNYFVAVASMAIGGVSFVPELNKKVFLGWGHTIFHITLMIYAQTISDSARKVLLVDELK
jgi:hypothetical protein